jgi:hypothetical protein
MKAILPRPASESFGMEIGPMDTKRCEIISRLRSSPSKQCPSGLFSTRYPASVGETVRRHDNPSSHAPSKKGSALFQSQLPNRATMSPSSMDAQIPLRIALIALRPAAMSLHFAQKCRCDNRSRGPICSTSFRCCRSIVASPCLGTLGNSPVRVIVLFMATDAVMPLAMNLSWSRHAACRASPCARHLRIIPIPIGGLSPRSDPGCARVWRDSV